MDSRPLSLGEAAPPEGPAERERRRIRRGLAVMAVLALVVLATFMHFNAPTITGTSGARYSVMRVRREQGAHGTTFVLQFRTRGETLETVEAEIADLLPAVAQLAVMNGDSTLVVQASRPLFSLGLISTTKSVRARFALREGEWTNVDY